MTSTTETFDFSDVREVLADVRHREHMQAMRLGFDTEWSSDWLTENCLGDGFDRHHLLAGTESAATDRSVTMSGLIVEGRGVHSHATFCRVAGV